MMMMMMMIMTALWEITFLLRAFVCIYGWITLVAFSNILFYNLFAFFVAHFSRNHYVEKLIKASRDRVIMQISILYTVLSCTAVLSLPIIPNAQDGLLNKRQAGPDQVNDNLGIGDLSGVVGVVVTGVGDAITGVVVGLEGDQPLSTARSELLGGDATDLTGLEKRQGILVDFGIIIDHIGFDVSLEK